MNSPSRDPLPRWAASGHVGLGLLLGGALAALHCDWGDASVSRVDGRQLFLSRCAGCHGEEGKGDGPAAAQLIPPPADFTRGQFKFGTTRLGESPSDADLVRTITERIYWSAMHPYGDFNADEVAALVGEVKRLSRHYDDARGAWVDFFAAADGRQVLDVPPAPPRSPGILAQGARLYQAQCASCHGDQGRGDGPAAVAMRDFRGQPLPVRDLTIPIYKGGATERDVFVRISRGLPGTPMPAFTNITPNERWAVAYHVRSLQEWPERAGARGALLYRAYGCEACHGVAGVGGVPDPGYVKERIPALRGLAERLFLYEPEDVATFSELLEQRADLDALPEEPDIPRWPAVKAQFEAVVGVIRKGSRAGKSRADGPAPPIDMPIWGHKLQGEDIRDIMAYLLNLPADEESTKKE